MPDAYLRYMLPLPLQYTFLGNQQALGLLHMSCFERGVINGTGVRRWRLFFSVWSVTKREWDCWCSLNAPPPSGLSNLVRRYHSRVCSHCLLRGLLTVQEWKIELLTEIKFHGVHDVLLEILIEGFSYSRFSHSKLWCQSCHENICPPHMGFTTKLQIPSTF